VVSTLSYQNDNGVLGNQKLLNESGLLVNEEVGIVFEEKGLATGRFLNELI